jgi:hypothetical protein
MVARSGRNSLQEKKFRVIISPLMYQMLVINLASPLIRRLVDLKGKSPAEINFSLKITSMSLDISLTRQMIVSVDIGTSEISLAASGSRMIFTISLQGGRQALITFQLL